jgi:hypothetical protein
MSTKIYGMIVPKDIADAEEPVRLTCEIAPSDGDELLDGYLSEREWVVYDYKDKPGITWGMWSIRRAGNTQAVPAVFMRNDTLHVVAATKRDARRMCATVWMHLQALGAAGFSPDNLQQQVREWNERFDRIVARVAERDATIRDLTGQLASSEERLAAIKCELQEVYRSIAKIEGVCNGASPLTIYANE